MKQRHRVYTKEEDILAAIDRYTAKLQQGRKRCTELQSLIRKCRRRIAKARYSSAVDAPAHDLVEYQTESDRISKYLRSIEDTTLPRLKRTLAAFRTKTFDFMGDYQGVVAA